MEFQPHWCYSFESLLTFVVIVCYSMQHRWFLLNSTTLYNAILRIARMFLETRENIKISTHPFYHINLGWFSWEWSKFFFFFFRKKKFKMADSKKAHFSKSPILKIFSRKFLRLVLGLVGLNDAKGIDSHENQPKFIW